MTQEPVVLKRRGLKIPPLKAALQCIGQKTNITKMKVITVIKDQDVIKKILKHVGLWEVKPRSRTRNSKSQLLSTEPHIDYSKTQVCPSDNGFYEHQHAEPPRFAFCHLTITRQDTMSHIMA